jgi:hypothetical protein
VKLPCGRFWALAPESIYHVCAGNLAASSLTQAILGLMLGSRLFFKLPSGGLPAFEDRIRCLPRELSERIVLLRVHDPECMRAADVVVVSGSDDSVEDLRRASDARKRFIGYGHKISAAIFPAATSLEAWVEPAMKDLRTYDQIGCLSPQAFVCEGPCRAEALGLLLAAKFHETPRSANPLTLNDAAAVRDARDRLLTGGHKIMGPDSLDWTVAVRQDGRFLAGPGHGFIQIVGAANVLDAFAEWKGWISSIAIARENLGDEEALWAKKIGANRVCRLGEAQGPRISWRHDGRPALGDLVSWISVE